jgi:hypothetical protein
MSFGADEAQHLIAVAGAALLIWQARTAGTRVANAGAADATGWPQAAPNSDTAEVGNVSQLEGPPRIPGGGAARAAAPDAARVTAATGTLEGEQRAGAGQAPGLTGAGQRHHGARPPRPGRDGDGREAVA